MNKALQTQNPHHGYLHLAVDQALSRLGGAEHAQFKEWALALPARLRENGLQQTLLAMRHDASASDQMTGVWHLLQLWLGDGTPASFSLGALLAGREAAERAATVSRSQQDYVPSIANAQTGAGSPHATTANYLLSTALAMAEAQRIKRSVEAVLAASSSAPVANAAGADAEANAAQRAPPPSAAAGATPQQPGPVVQTPRPATLAPAAGAEHFGLYWRYGGVPHSFHDHGNKANTHHSDHINQVLALANPGRSNLSGHNSLYAAAYKRWLGWLNGLTNCTTQVATASNRLMLGVGAATVHDAQVLLHPVTGMPYSPGSTLKGALRAWFKRQIEKLKLAQSQPQVEQLAAAEKWVFGDAADSPDSAQGGVVFFDAWWVPNGTQNPLVREVETPHHLDYYAGRQAQPTAWDSPIPVAQMAVQGQFLLALQVPTATDASAWAPGLMQWLVAALADAERGGIGAKTFSAGYGRFDSP